MRLADNINSLVTEDLLLFLLFSFGIAVCFFLIIALFIDRQARNKIVEPINKLTEQIENPKELQVDNDINLKGDRIRKSTKYTRD